MTMKARTFASVNALIMMAIGVSLASLKSVAQNNQTNDLSSLCEFYTKYDDVKNCGPTGYPVRYGKRYCEAFARRIQDFSRRGKSWLESTLVCLQNELRPTMHDPSITCDSLNDLSIDHHAKCYVENGFCELGFKDKLATLSITRSDLFTSNFFQGMSRSSYMCGDRYNERLENMDPQLKRALEREIEEGIFDRHYLEMLYLLRSENAHGH